MVSFFVSVCSCPTPSVTANAVPAPSEMEPLAVRVSFRFCQGPHPRGQQRRPRPVADTGRNCWGRGLQDASAAQGAKQMQGAATRCCLRKQTGGVSSSHCIPSDFMLYCLLLCFLRGILSEQLRILGSPACLEPCRAKPTGAGGPVRSKSSRWSIIS